MLVPVLIFNLGYEDRISSYNKVKFQDSSTVVALESDKDEGEKNKLETDKQSYIIKSSGIVKSVPWENDIDFKEAQEKNRTYVMMAAYCAVLPDPLPGEEENVHIGAKLLCGKVVGAGKVFSQNRSIGPYTEVQGYKKGPTYVGSHIITTIGGGVCKIASTLYNVAVLSNLQIVERHSHGMPVSYVPYGQDATVSYGNRDFKFKNNTEFPILIWTESIGNSLYIGFYGNSKPPKIEWHHELLSSRKTTKIYKINPKLKPGTKKVVVIGMDGAVLKSWVTVEKADGTVITKQLGKSSYAPLPYIYEKGR
jgi:vancomycin resistance protein YoaR